MHKHPQKGYSPRSGSAPAFPEAESVFRSGPKPFPAEMNPRPGVLTHRLLISATSKGGVGRSFFLINLADWLMEMEQPFVFFDSDICNGTLTRFFPESRFLSMGDPEEAARELGETVSRNELVAWDALGPMQQYLPDWIEQTLLDGQSALDSRITVVLMIEEDKDTVFQAGETTKRLGDRVDWLVVKNLKTCSTTEIYDNSKARQELLRLGAVEITMERVPWSLLATIQKTSRTLSSLVLDESLPFLERQRLRTFQRRFFEQLENARHLLLPARPVEPSVPSRHDHAKPAARPRVAPEEV